MKALPRYTFQTEDDLIEAMNKDLRAGKKAAKKLLSTIEPTKVVDNEWLKAIRFVNRVQTYTYYLSDEMRIYMYEISEALKIEITVARDKAGRNYLAHIAEQKSLNRWC